MNIAIIIALALLAVVAAFFYVSYRKMKKMPAVEDHEKIITLTDQNFQSKIKSGITLVDFWAEWCVPCKMIAPTLNSVAKELDGNASVGKLNIELHRTVAAKFRVRSIPTMIMFRDGKEINRYTGVKTKDFLMKEIRKVQ